MKTPLISVVIPAYNRADTIRRAVNSALAQIEVLTQIIVVDDGSTEPLTGVLEDYAGTVAVLRLPRRLGQNAARNAGIGVSRGKYIAFLDSDDEWLPEKLVTQLCRMNDSDRCVFSGTRFYEIASTGSSISAMQPSGDILADLLKQNVVGGFSAMLVRKTALDTIGLLDETLESSADWDTAIRLAGCGTYAAINEPLYRYYLHGRNIRDNPSVLWRGRLRFFTKYHHLLSSSVRESYRQSLVAVGVCTEFPLDVKENGTGDVSG